MLVCRRVGGWSLDGGISFGFEDLGSLEKIACGAECFVRSQGQGMRIESAVYGSWN